MQPSSVKACCADLYQSDLARLVLGDTMHPGGLALTRRLGQLMGVKPGHWLVDLAAGPGVSAAALSRVFRCRVVGIEFGRPAVSEALATSGESLIPPDTFFLQGDAESPPLRPSSVDAIICECSMSLFPDQSRAVQEAFRALRPGGVLGISDVTLEPGCLPEELGGAIGRVLCLSGARTVQGYAGLLEQSGFGVQRQEDASREILALLDDLESKVGALLAWLSISGTGPARDADAIKRAPTIIARLRQLVTEGKLGYWLFVARKPQ